MADSIRVAQPIRLQRLHSRILLIKNSGFPRIILGAETDSMINFQNNLLQTSTVNIIHAFDDYFIVFQI